MLVLPETLTVVLVTEDADLAKHLGDDLRCAHHSFECVAPRRLHRRLADGVPLGQADAILLDLRDPDDERSWSLLPKLHEIRETTALLVLGDHAEEEERVEGLERGADDFLVMPFSSRELVARIRAIMRRALLIPTLRMGDLRLDVGHRKVEHAGERIDLTPREFDVLRTLMSVRGRGVTRDELFREVWGRPSDRETTTLEIQICRLRRKLRTCRSLVIETLPGKGYRLKDDGDD